jgi:hypothetical protein
MLQATTAVAPAGPIIWFSTFRSIKVPEDNDVHAIALPINPCNKLTHLLEHALFRKEGQDQS